MTKGPISKRELRALAYRIADDIETLAHKLMRSKPMTWDTAVDQVIQKISEKEY